VATGNAAVAVRIQKEVSTRKRLKTFLSRYFYLCLSLVMAWLVVWGFSHTVNTSLFHAHPPRPLLLWIHGAAFSTWIVFFIVQSALVRVRKVSVHRFIGWFGAGLAAVMVVLGCTIAVIMSRFDSGVLHQKGVQSFLSVPFEDMIVFGTLMALAIYWRKKPEYHRRLVFIATCVLMDAAIGRFDFWDRHHLYYAALDLLIVLGMVRDWVVDGRVHKVYLYALPPIIVLQSVAMYAYLANPGWWQATTRAILAW
jgi:FtsH-binding integral membrane protein